MPPKKSNNNTPKSDQDHEEPPLRKNVDDHDISFEVEEHDDTANLKHKDSKGDEERDQLTDGNVNDQTLFKLCFDKTISKKVKPPSPFRNATKYDYPEGQAPTAAQPEVQDDQAENIAIGNIQDEVHDTINEEKASNVAIEEKVSDDTLFVSGAVKNAEKSISNNEKISSVEIQDFDTDNEESKHDLSTIPRYDSSIFDKGKLACLLLSHNNSKVPASLLAERAKVSDELFGDEAVMEIVGSALQSAFIFPSIETDFNAQQQWSALIDEVRDYLKQSNATWNGLLALLEKCAQRGLKRSAFQQTKIADEPEEPAPKTEEGLLAADYDLSSTD